MRSLIVLVAVGAAAAVTALLTLRVLMRETRPLMVSNYRGRRLPVVLGTGLTAGLCFTLVGEVLGRPSGTQGRSRELWLIPLFLIVFLAGRYDDRRASEARGLAGHFRELSRGRVTSGIVKLVAAVLAALLWALITHAGILRLVLGVAVIAGAANLWNFLDVAPGRALKYGLLAAAAIAIDRMSALVAATVGITAVLLILDVRERAMLGDAGANVLGLAIGVALFDRLSNGGLAIAVVAVVLLHLLAEAVTLSRIIRSVPPLRWLDNAGRLRVREVRAS